MLYWAWLTSLELFTLGLMALTASIYIAFVTAIGLQARESIMKEQRRQEEQKKQICVLPN